VKAELQPRPFDIPWMVLDSSRAEKDWNWRPTVLLPAILEEIAEHAISHPQWLDMTS
jgi:CDP-paratose 2-epimerase